MATTARREDMAPTVEGAKNIGVTALNFYEGALRGVGSGLAYVGWLPVVGLVARVPVHAAACVVEGYHSTTMRIASKSITDDPSIENIERCARKALTSKQRMALREIANME